MTNLRVLILAALAISALSIDPDVYDQFERHAHGLERQLDAAHEAYNHYGRPADARNIRLIEQQLDELSEAYEAMIQHDHQRGYEREHVQEHEEQEHDQQQQDHEQQEHEQPQQELFNCFDLYDSNLGMRPWHDFRDCESEKPHCHEHGGEGGSHAITFDGDGEENVGKLTATRLQVGCAETCGTCDVMQEYLANQKSKEVTKGANHDTNVDTQRRQRGQELQMRERRQQQEQQQRRQQQQEEVWRKQIVEHLQQLQRSNPVQALIAESALPAGSFRTWLEEAANVVVNRLAAAATGGTDGTGSRKPNKHWMVVKQAIGLPPPPSEGGTNVAVPSKHNKQYEVEDQSISQHVSRQQKQQRKREQRQQKQQKKQQQKKQQRKKQQQQMQQQKAAEQAAQHQRRQSRSERWEELRAQALRNEVVKESRRGERGVRGMRPEWSTKTGVGRREALARRGREMGLIVEVEDY